MMRSGELQLSGIQIISHLNVEKFGGGESVFDKCKNVEITFQIKTHLLQLTVVCPTVHS